MDSRTYWKKRETEQKKHNITEEADYNAEIERLYRNTMTAIQKEIDGFYGRYASKEGISIAEAKKRASKLDIEAYEEKAAQYVKEKNFSKQANEEMRLYNLTMKVNRLELLKANIGMELVSNANELQQFYDQKLTDRSIDQFERMSGILGKTVKDNAKTAHAIVNASFHNATWSQRIWTNQSMLKNELDRLLTSGIITGKNPRELARRLKKTFAVETSKAERLMRTELARVRIASQEQSLKANGFDKYEFIALGDACGTCKGLDGKTFTLKQLKISGNAPPMHPNCRCAIAPATNDPEYEAWLDGFSEHGLSFEEWKKRNEAFNIPAFFSDIIETEKNEARAIDAIHQLDSDENVRYTKIEILDELNVSKVGRKTIDNIENSNVKILISDEEEPSGNRGFQQGDFITVYSKNIKNKKVAAQTIIHEMTHYYYNIGRCQHAEAICMAMEKMHLTGNDYVTEDEWEYVKKLAIDNYPELNWEAGGYGDYEQFDIIRKDKRK